MTGQTLTPHPSWTRKRYVAFWIYVVSRLNDQLPKFVLTPLIRITSQLYVGPQLSKRGWQKLRDQYNVRSVVNLRVERDDRDRGIEPEHYLWLPTIDHTSPTVEQLQRATEFIHARIQAGDAVYIHCAAGVGRAPLTAASYLVSQGHSPEEALDLIRSRRPFISQSTNQRTRLEQFARYIQEGGAPVQEKT